MSEKEIIGMYKGDNLNVADVVEDMANSAAERVHKEMSEQGFVYVGTYDKNTPVEERRALVEKAVKENAKDFYGN